MIFVSATYAAAVLFRMSEDKGGEYTKRLSQELKSSLYQRGQEENLWGDQMAPADLQVRVILQPRCLLYRRVRVIQIYHM